MSDRESLFTAQAEIIALADDWLDGRVSDTYQGQPLAQHWARVAKVVEESGESIEALIAWTGQNPRKPQRDEAREELLAELADVVVTATLAIQHFTKDTDETLDLLEARLSFLYQRMRASDPGWFGEPTFAIGQRVTITGEQHPWHSYSGEILAGFTRAGYWVVELDNGMRPTVAEREMSRV